MPPNFRSPGTVGLIDEAHAVNRGPVGTATASDAATKQLQELSLDLIQLAFDLAGFVDPTPVSDGASALISLARGQWFDAVISGVSMIPYVGDLAKAGKLPKYLKSIEKAVALADESKKCAAMLLEPMRKLAGAIDLIPAGANKYIDDMRRTIDRFLTRHGGGKVVNEVLPDVGGQFRFRTYTQGDRVVKEASGRLGVPGKVRSHRKTNPSEARKAQSGVSSGSGDHAGHMIADQFGAPPGKPNQLGLGTENLSLQNHRMNSGGTWWDLEKQWSKKLDEGYGYEITVSDWFRKGETRPYKRKVSGIEIAPDGKRKPFNAEGEVIYGNFSTEKSRKAMGIESTQDKPGRVVQGPWKGSGESP